MQNETKKWWESRGIWGGILVVLGLLLQFFGLQLSAEEQNQISGLIIEIIAVVSELVGAILAIVGRFKAKTRIE